MTYVDGFVLAVPTARRQEFIDMAHEGVSAFLDRGATRAVECWGDDVPDGTRTDLRRAVEATDEETVVFAWIEWPDKATRDVAMEQMRSDPEMQAGAKPMPFDTSRMIFGGFVPVVERTA